MVIIAVDGRPGAARGAAVLVPGFDEAFLVGGRASADASAVHEVSVVVGDVVHPDRVGLLVVGDVAADVGEDGAEAGADAGVVGQAHEGGHGYGEVDDPASERGLEPTTGTQLPVDAGDGDVGRVGDGVRVGRRAVTGWDGGAGCCVVAGRRSAGVCCVGLR